MSVTAHEGDFIALWISHGGEPGLVIGKITWMGEEVFAAPYHAPANSPHKSPIKLDPYKIGSTQYPPTERSFLVYADLIEL